MNEAVHQYYQNLPEVELHAALIDIINDQYTLKVHEIAVAVSKLSKQDVDLRLTVHNLLILGTKQYLKVYPVIQSQGKTSIITNAQLLEAIREASYSSYRKPFMGPM